MSWVIMVDLRENNSHFVNIEDKNGNIAQFGTEQEARDTMRDHPLSAYPCYAINVDDEEISCI